MTPFLGVDPLTKHPAKFSEPILDVFRSAIRRGLADGVDLQRPMRILDPFAGVGRIHQLAIPGKVTTVGIEIEPEWAACHRDTGCADSLEWMKGVQPEGWFDVVVTSPCYGNRFADHHDARDGSVRRSYRHDLGRMPTEGSAATLYWGPDYWRFHSLAYRRIYSVLRPGGLFVLNVSDFIRDGQTVRATDWHDGACWGAGFERDRRDSRIWVQTSRHRHGQNHQARVDGEIVFVFRRPIR